MSEPLVSVLLCTINRAERMKIAVDCFRQQTYPNLELIVVASGVQDVSELVADILNCTYIWSTAKNLSTKRNAGIRAAQGTYICHFDDDDWSGPERVADQYAALLRGGPGKVMHGYSTAFWWDEVRNCASQYRGSAWGATLFYERAWALEHPWLEDRDLAEDSPFISNASMSCALAHSDARDNFVAVMHDGTAQRGYDPNFWPVIDRNLLPAEFRRLWRLS